MSSESQASNSRSSVTECLNPQPVFGAPDTGSFYVACGSCSVCERDDLIRRLEGEKALITKMLEEAEHRARMAEIRLQTAADLADALFPEGGRT